MRVFFGTFLSSHAASAKQAMRAMAAHWGQYDLSAVVELAALISKVPDEAQLSQDDHIDEATLWASYCTCLKPKDEASAKAAFHEVRWCDSYHLCLRASLSVVQSTSCSRVFSPPRLQCFSLFEGYEYTASYGQRQEVNAGSKQTNFAGRANAICFWALTAVDACGDDSGMVRYASLFL